MRPPWAGQLTVSARRAGHEFGQPPGSWDPRPCALQGALTVRLRLPSFVVTLAG